jgi:hypothetical protein
MFYINSSSGVCDLQLFLRAREESQPIEALTGMKLIAAIAAAGPWPLGEEVLRCLFVWPSFHRLDKLEAPDMVKQGTMAAEDQALYSALQQARNTPAPHARGALRHD